MVSEVLLNGSFEMELLESLDFYRESPENPKIHIKPFYKKFCGTHKLKRKVVRHSLNVLHREGLIRINWHSGTPYLLLIDDFKGGRKDCLRPSPNSQKKREVN